MVIMQKQVSIYWFGGMANMITLWTHILIV